MATKSIHKCDFCDFETENVDELAVVHEPVMLLERTKKKKSGVVLKWEIEYQKCKTQYAHMDLCKKCIKKYEEVLGLAVDQFNSIVMGFLPESTGARFFDKETGEETTKEEATENKEKWWKIFFK